MNRFGFLSVSAIAAIALAVIPTEIVAQQKTLKDQLVGVWTLVSAETIEPNGTKFPLVKGSPIKGFQVFTADGKVSFQIIGGSRQGRVQRSNENDTGGNESER